MNGITFANFYKANGKSVEEILPLVKPDFLLQATST